MNETKARTTAKAVIWAICGSLVMFVTSWWFIEDTTILLYLIITYAVSRVIIFWLYNYAWGHIKWGVIP